MVRLLDAACPCNGSSRSATPVEPLRARKLGMPVSLSGVLSIDPIKAAGVTSAGTLRALPSATASILDPKVLLPSGVAENALFLLLGDVPYQGNLVSTECCNN